MSSTYRSKSRDNHTADYYVTPIQPIVKFLSEIQKYEPNIFKGNILDCCAGGDINHHMSYPDAFKQIGINNIDTIDIRQNSLASIKTDYLTYICKNEYDVIITNPPFVIAREIISKALDDVKDNGFVIMLLRLNYYGSKDRKSFWDTTMTKYTFIDHIRMSFTDDKKTDSIEYAHYCFQKGYNSDFSLLKVI